MSFFQNILTGIAQRMAKTMVTSPTAVFGELDGMKYQYSEIAVPAVKISQVVFSLPFAISGQVYIHQAMEEQPLWNKDGILESVEFNDRVKVFASSKKLAFEILSPDVMAWYLDLKEMPQILFKDQTVIVSFSASLLSKEEHLQIAHKVYYFMQHSAVR
jgi:hypothetical protein